MRGFVNTLTGADYNDVHEWAVHLRQHFPERRDTIDAALHLPISEEKRQIAVRRIIEGQIESLLRYAESAKHREERAVELASDPVKAAEHTLAKIGDAALEQLARRLSISVAAARQILLERLARGESADAAVD